MTQLRPGPKKDTHKTQALVRARWHNPENTLIRIRTTEAHYIIGPDHPRWEEAKAIASPYLGSVEIPAFLAEPEPAPETSVPHDLADLIEAADTPAEANAKLLAKWNEANGLIQIAHDRGERPPIELILKRDRLESGIRWNRGRLAEQI